MAFPSLLSFLAILFLSSQLTGCHRLHISPRGNQVRDVHAKLILSCSIEDYVPEKKAESDLRLTWIGPNTQYTIGSHGRVHTESETGGTIKLYIHRIETTDAGPYTCQLDDDGQIVTETVHLGLFEDIRFHNQSLVYRVRVKSGSVLLECSASGTPVPTISWRFNKTKLPKESEKYRYEEEGLRIYDVTLDDSGTYECRAQVESQGSLKMRSVHLDVLYPPVIAEPPRVVGPVIKGVEAVLHCQADGNPPPKYEWYLERRMSEFVKAKVQIQREGQTLRIQNFGSENEGRYFCRVSNSLGTKESHVDVTMLVPPVIKDFGAHVTVEGRTMILPCEVIEGRPSPDLFWSKASSDQVTVAAGGQLLEEQGEDGRISVDKARRGISKLIIRDVRRSHSGVYLCHAINAVGNSTKAAKISVDYSPEMNSSVAELFGWSGQARNLTCIADGQPPPSIAWFSRGQPIFDTAAHKIITTRTTAPVITSTLQITIGSRQSWLFGNYSCVAKNSHGSSSTAFHLREGEVPGLPHNVSVLKVSATNTVLLAAPPTKTGGVALASWKVKYESIPGNMTTNETVFDHIPGESLMRMTISDLRPSSDYAFYLSAGNEVGFGEAIKFLVKTKEKSVLEEQSGVPRRSSAAENTWEDPEALEKAIAEGSDDQDGGGRPSTGGAVLGVFSVLAAMALLAVGGVFLRRRRRARHCGGMEKWLGFLFGKDDPPEKNQQPQGDDEVIQMGEVAPAEDFLPPPPLGALRSATGGTEEEEEESTTLKATDSFESGFDGRSPRPPPRRGFGPQEALLRSPTATPMSVRKLGGIVDQTWSGGGGGGHTTHGSTDDLSSGVGTAEPESIQSDLGPDDEAGTAARGMLAQHDPDLDSIPDIDDDEDEDDLGQL